MQRITWNGIALHGGPLPGYAASHGCVRMPFGFAEKLFDKTRIGMRVIISPNDAAPVEFSHPALSRTESGGHRGRFGAGRATRPRGRGGRQGCRGGEEKPPRRRRGRPHRSRRRCASWNRSRAAPTPSSHPPTKRLPPQRRTRPRRGPRTASRRPRPRPGSGDTARHRQGRREVKARRRCRRKGRRQGGRGQEGRLRQGSERGETRARAGLDLHQPRDAEALRATQHSQAVPGRGRRGVRFRPSKSRSRSAIPTDR